MRTLVILSLVACIYLHFRSREAELVQLDSLSFKQSSIKKISLPQIKLPSVAESTMTLPVSGFVESDNDPMFTQADVTEEFDEDDLSQLPWDDIEEGWKNHLKEFLVSVDPEKAEDMYSAYLEEKKKYVERVDFTDQDGAVENEAISDPLVEHDANEGELERTHKENLKEIFGDNYSKVESLHQEYVESVQYLNHSSVKFSISL
jgi:hypothetical protein